MDTLESKKLRFGIKEAQGIINSFGWLIELSNNSETRDFCSSHINENFIYKTSRKMELEIEKLQIEIPLTNEMIISLRRSADYIMDLIPDTAKADKISLKQFIRKIDTHIWNEDRKNN